MRPLESQGYAELVQQTDRDPEIHPGEPPGPGDDTG